MSKIYRVDDPIYNIPLFICIGKLNEYRDFLFKKYKVQPELKPSGGYFLNVTNGNGISHNTIWLPCYKKNNIEDNTSLIHECLHASMHTMGLVNVPVTPENNEATAYLQGFYYSQFLNKLNKTKKGKMK